ncbi:MAG: hypothetical protein JSS23_00155 [Proteobacteria bacterium]|nr:hypothetical protein [Pseudomonadota bacterium]
MGALVKTPIITVVSPAVPAQGPIPPIPVLFFATPPPLGYSYTPVPTTPAGFANWVQLFQPPLVWVNEVDGYTFHPLSGFLPDGEGSVELPPGAEPVYGMVPATPPAVGDELAVIGYVLPNIVSRPLPPQWWGRVHGMIYVEFDGDTAPNGYPLGDGPFTGHFDVPLAGGGYQHITRTYIKASLGILVPTDHMTLPPYCVQGGACKVVMLSGFPGAPAIPAQPEVDSIDYREGWNAGATSIDALDGDVHTVFSVDIHAAAIVGFCASRPDVTDYTQITHGFYFDRDPMIGARRCAIMESGGVVGAWFACAVDDVFEIRRQTADGTVTYNVNATDIYTSARPLFGVIQVGTSLYMAGDEVF